MLDSGANRNYASMRMGQALRRLTHEKENPYPLMLADGAPTNHNDGWIRREIRKASLTIGGHEETIDLDITNIRYDMILGMAWLRLHNPAIDWGKRTLEFNCSHQPVPIVKAIWVRPVGRILASTEIPELPPEYEEFAELFKEREGPAALPEHGPWDHEIPIIPGEELTHYAGLRPLSKKEEEFMKEYVETNEAKKFIRPSTSPIAHGVVFANKKDGGLRPCIDFRPTNNKTIKNRHPLPRIDESQDRLLGSEWFTAIDIRDAFNRIRMKEGEEWKTAFRTRWGHYEYTVMPFGLTNAPASFQKLINDTLREYLDDFVVAYLDDILIFSKTYQEHVEHVKKVLRKLQERDLPVKLSKCEFHKHEVRFLGYIVSKDGLSADPKKIESIRDWPEPTTVKEVQAALGLFNYYRKFIKDFSKIAAPLTELTKKDIPFRFETDQRKAFNELKRLLTESPLLIIFDPEKEAILETDASDGAIGASLNQVGSDGKRRPVAFYSRKMTGPERNYDIHDKELLAVVEAFRTWRVYLEGLDTPVQVYTDHKNLLYWTTTKELNRRQVRWSETLSRFRFKIHHVRGNENGSADALSRRPDYMQELQPGSHTILKENPEDKSISYNTESDFSEWEEICNMNIEFTTEQKQHIIKTRHDDKTAGHPGINKTIELITRDFTWPKLRRDVEEYIQKCDVCAKAKHSRHKPYGLLQSPSLPERAWSKVALDFIVKLPKSKEPLTGVEYDSILVVVEYLTKYTYLLPYKEAAKAEDLAYVFLKTIISQHGTPEEIVSDRGTVFTSQFWQSLTDLMGIKHKLSTSYHPQTDGQTERTNQTTEQYLRCYVNHEQNNWVQLLPMAQFAFNNNASATGISPFYANYGFHPKIDRDARELKPIAEKAETTVNKLRALHSLLKQELEKIATNTATNANRKRSEGPDFQEGERVYLLRKNIKTKRPSDKLDHTKLGPYKIKKKLGPVTFELDLPSNMRIHPTFHKSLLEKCHNRTARPEPVEIDEETQEPRYVVEGILDQELRNGKPYYLIKWMGYDHSENTWEPKEHLGNDILIDYHRDTPVLTAKKRGRPKKLNTQD